MCFVFVSHSNLTLFLSILFLSTYTFLSLSIYLSLCLSLFVCVCAFLRSNHWQFSFCANRLAKISSCYKADTWRCLYKYIYIVSIYGIEYFLYAMSFHFHALRLSGRHSNGNWACKRQAQRCLSCIRYRIWYDMCVSIYKVYSIWFPLSCGRCY